MLYRFGIIYIVFTCKQLVNSLFMSTYMQLCYLMHEVARCIAIPIEWDAGPFQTVLWHLSESNSEAVAK